jgi:transposase
MGARRFLTEEKWQKIQPLIPKMKSNGRPWRDNREVLEGILWVLHTGARWCDLPSGFPHYSTCWRRLKLWEEQGVWLKLWRVFLAELDRQGKLDWTEAFLDGSFVPAKGGAPKSARPRWAKGPS